MQTAGRRVGVCRCFSVLCSVLMLGTVASILCGSAVPVSGTEPSEPEYNLYFGDLHSHTSYSDGEGTPDEAFEAAQAAGADFLALTDHHYLLRDVEWADTLRSADEHSSSTFAAMAAYEYFIPGINELNIYGIPYMPPAASNYRPTGVFPWIYDWIAGEPGAVGQWNHPLSYGYPDAWDYFQFAFLNDERDEAMGMLEVYNWGYRDSSYVKALDAGWHMMPTATEDDHYGDWISPLGIRTVLLAPSLAREDLYDAMREGRGYATLDDNLEIRFTVDGAVLGSNLLNPGAASYTASIEILDPDLVGDEITLVEIVSDNNVTVCSFKPNSNSFTELDIELCGEGAPRYFFVRVTTVSPLNGNIEGVTAWTAPVWTGN